MQSQKVRLLEQECREKDLTIQSLKKEIQDRTLNFFWQRQRRGFVCRKCADQNDSKSNQSRSPLSITLNHSSSSKSIQRLGPSDQQFNNRILSLRHQIQIQGIQLRRLKLIEKTSQQAKCVLNQRLKSLKMPPYQDPLLNLNKILQRIIPTSQQQDRISEIIFCNKKDVPKAKRFRNVFVLDLQVFPSYRKPLLKIQERQKVNQRLTFGSDLSLQVMPLLQGLGQRQIDSVTPSRKPYLQTLGFTNLYQLEIGPSPGSSLTNKQLQLHYIKQITKLQVQLQDYRYQKHKSSAKSSKSSKSLVLQSLPQIDEDEMNRLQLANQELQTQLQQLKNESANKLELAYIREQSRLKQLKQVIQHLQNELKYKTLSQSNLLQEVDTLRNNRISYDSHSQLQNQLKRSLQSLQLLTNQLNSTRIQKSSLMKENQIQARELQQTPALKRSLAEKDQIIISLQLDLKNSKFNFNKQIQQLNRTHAQKILDLQENSRSLLARLNASHSQLRQSIPQKQQLVTSLKDSASKAERVLIASREEKRRVQNQLLLMGEQVLKLKYFIDNLQNQNKFIKQNYEKVVEQKEQIKQKLSQSQALMRLREQQLNEAQENFDQLKSSFSRLQIQHQETLEKEGQKAKRLLVLQSQQNILQQNIESNSSLLAQKQMQIQKVSNQLKTANRNIDKLKQTYKQTENRLNKQISQLSNQLVQQKNSVSVLSRESQNIKSHTFKGDMANRLKQQNKRLQQLNSNLQLEKDQLQKRIFEARQENTALKTKSQFLAQSKETLNLNIKSLSSELNDLRQQVQTIKLNEIQLKEKLFSKQVQLKSAKSQIQQLRQKTQRSNQKTSSQNSQKSMQNRLKTRISQLESLYASKQSQLNSTKFELTQRSKQCQIHYQNLLKISKEEQEILNEELQKQKDKNLLLKKQNEDLKLKIQNFIQNQIQFLQQKESYQSLEQQLARSNSQVQKLREAVKQLTRDYQMVKQSQLKYKLTLQEHKRTVLQSEQLSQKNVEKQLGVQQRKLRQEFKDKIQTLRTDFLQKIKIFQQQQNSLTQDHQSRIQQFISSQTVSQPVSLTPNPLALYNCFCLTLDNAQTQSKAQLQRVTCKLADKTVLCLELQQKIRQLQLKIQDLNKSVNLHNSENLKESNELKLRIRRIQEQNTQLHLQMSQLVKASADEKQRVLIEQNQKLNRLITQLQNLRRSQTFYTRVNQSLKQHLQDRQQIIQNLNNQIKESEHQNKIKFDKITYALNQRQRALLEKQQKLELAQKNITDLERQKQTILTLWKQDKVQFQREREIIDSRLQEISCKLMSKEIQLLKIQKQNTEQVDLLRKRLQHQQTKKSIKIEMQMELLQILNLQACQKKMNYQVQILPKLIYQRFCQHAETQFNSQRALQICQLTKTQTLNANKPHRHLLQQEQTQLHQLFSQGQERYSPQNQPVSSQLEQSQADSSGNYIRQNYIRQLQQHIDALIKQTQNLKQRISLYEIAWQSREVELEQSELQTTSIDQSNMQRIFLFEERRKQESQSYQIKQKMESILKKAKSNLLFFKNQVQDIITQDLIMVSSNLNSACSKERSEVSDFDLSRNQSQLSNQPSEMLSPIKQDWHRLSTLLKSALLSQQAEELCKQASQTRLLQKIRQLMVKQQQINQRSDDIKKMDQQLTTMQSKLAKQKQVFKTLKQQNQILAKNLRKRDQSLASTKQKNQTLQHQVQKHQKTIEELHSKINKYEALLNQQKEKFIQEQKRSVIYKNENIGLRNQVNRVTKLQEQKNKAAQHYQFLYDNQTEAYKKELQLIQQVCINYSKDKQDRDKKQKCNFKVRLFIEQLALRAQRLSEQNKSLQRIKSVWNANKSNLRQFCQMKAQVSKQLQLFRTAIKDICGQLIQIGKRQQSQSEAFKKSINLQCQKQKENQLQDSKELKEKNNLLGFQRKQSASKQSNKGSKKDSFNSYKSFSSSPNSLRDQHQQFKSESSISIRPEAKQPKSLKKKLSQFHNKNKHLTQDIERLTQKNQILEEEVTSLRRKLQDYIIHQNQRYLSLNQITNSFNSKEDQYKQSIRAIEDKNKKLLSEILLKEQNIAQLKRSLIELSEKQARVTRPICQSRGIQVDSQSPVSSQISEDTKQIKLARQRTYSHSSHDLLPLQLQQPISQIFAAEPISQRQLKQKQLSSKFQRKKSRISTLQVCLQAIVNPVQRDLINEQIQTSNGGSDLQMKVQNQEFLNKKNQFFQRILKYFDKNLLLQPFITELCFNSKDQFIVQTLFNRFQQEERKKIYQSPDYQNLQALQKQYQIQQSILDSQIKKNHQLESQISRLMLEMQQGKFNSKQVGTQTQAVVRKVQFLQQNNDMLQNLVRENNKKVRQKNNYINQKFNELYFIFKKFNNKFDQVNQSRINQLLQSLRVNHYHDEINYRQPKFKSQFDTRSHHKLPSDSSDMSENNSELKARSMSFDQKQQQLSPNRQQQQAKLSDKHIQFIQKNKKLQSQLILMRDQLQSLKSENKTLKSTVKEQLKRASINQTQIQSLNQYVQQLKDKINIYSLVNVPQDTQKILISQHKTIKQLNSQLRLSYQQKQNTQETQQELTKKMYDQIVAQRQKEINTRRNKQREIQNCLLKIQQLQVENARLLKEVSKKSRVFLTTGRR